MWIPGPAESFEAPLAVTLGGTGADSFTSGHFLRGAGAGAVTAFDLFGTANTWGESQAFTGGVVVSGSPSTFTSDVSVLGTLSVGGNIVADTSIATFDVVNATTLTGDGSALTGIDFLFPLAQAEVSVTGATTATVGRMHVCSGTTYTLTLPAASGNAGKFVGVRVTATGLVTVDGNSTELIDGSQTRVMWAGESAILLCDGSNWFKVAGKTIPMTCELESGTTTTANHDTATKFDLGATLVNNTGLMGDTANSRITCRRTGNYLVSGMVNFTLLADQTRVIVFLYANGSAFKLASAFGAGANSTSYATAAALIPLTAGQVVELYGQWDVSGGSGTKDSVVSTSLVAPYLSVTEVPSW